MATSTYASPTVTKILLRHLSGSRVNQVEEFRIAHLTELDIGRDSGCQVRYDPDRDDLVGRHHAKINIESGDPPIFTLKDLGSRNGTYVNRQRIAAPVRLYPGDVVQLGPGGPEFMFDVEPHPPEALRPTRIAGEALTPPPKATRVADARPNGPSPMAVMPASVPPTGSIPGNFQTPVPLPTAPGGGIGKATVERMIGQAKSDNRLTIVLVASLVLVIVAGVVGYLGYLGYKQQKQVDTKIAATQEHAERVKQQAEAARSEVERQKADAPLDPSAIAAANSAAVVYLEVGWKLIYTQTGQQLYHCFRDGMPLFVRLEDGTTEPWLTTRPDGNRPIGGEHTGTGFVVGEEGFILTNRHVAASWKSRYEFPDATGMVFDVRTGNVSFLTQLPEWVPSETKQAGGKFLQGGFEGRNDYLYATFANKTQRILGQLSVASDRHDVALVKIGVPGRIKPVELFDSYDNIKPGDSVTVLGYPGLTPKKYGVIASKDLFNREAQTRVVPNVTVSSGVISALLRDDTSTTAAGRDRVVSVMGDSYQLSINSTGPGNSGGPVFDNRGRVVAVFNAGAERVTYAVPIRYGLELMNPAGR
ncbi:trypsin-like peptidase domain-containing protein [Chloracidobacterium validum]|uniref:Trypsin-like peptidase domain-containing protein n=1 Tax=Chloracidobacterium validum TaxID=2821543 RepID=A0ABX8BC94_9BACT|nr:trypsin-like peptidase domain-containing protein [Chloracidobacterium validum]QUW04324.1 trypsin-like peptidase domain-containing protein [Chloracidobacterium validum]